MPRRGLAELILVAACCLAAPFADAAGLRLFDIPADAGSPLTGIVWTPCAAPASEVVLGGGVVLPGVRDCLINGNRLPLIVVFRGHVVFLSNKPKICFAPIYEKAKPSCWTISPGVP